LVIFVQSPVFVHEVIFGLMRVIFDAWLGAIITKCQVTVEIIRFYQDLSGFNLGNILLKSFMVQNELNISGYIHFWSFF
jgi:hypothetical protein